MSQVVATALVADEGGFRLKRKWCSLAGVELCESLGIWNLVWGVCLWVTPVAWSGLAGYLQERSLLELNTRT